MIYGEKSCEHKFLVRRKLARAPFRGFGRGFFFQSWRDLILFPPFLNFPISGLSASRPEIYWRGTRTRRKSGAEIQRKYKNWRGESFWPEKRTVTYFYTRPLSAKILRGEGASFILTGKKEAEDSSTSCSTIIMYRFWSDRNEEIGS